MRAHDVLIFNDNACIVRHNHGYGLDRQFLILCLSVELVQYIHEIYIGCICFTGKKKQEK